jgi:hypothetical protein
MSMGNLFTVQSVVVDVMATDQTDAVLDHTTVVPERADSEPPGIDHLTVVPENADRSE